MRRSSFATVFAALLLLVLPTTLFAWGGDGHQIVCIIAEEHLTQESLQGIHELLGDANISDAAVASWADSVRRDWQESGPWHYVDIPVDAAAYDAKRDGHDGNNVIDAISDGIKVLSDRKEEKKDRVVALKFLAHLVGDVHQPMHCVDRDDRGGNGRLVFLLDQPRALNLHGVWDSGILLPRKGTMPILKYALQLDRKITPAQERVWAAGTAEDWANESHAVAATVAYTGVPKDGPPPKLDQKYVDKAGDVIDEQLEKAGIRLAMLLNQCFAAAGPETPVKK